jgi:hypothetical protein
MLPINATSLIIHNIVVSLDEYNTLCLVPVSRYMKYDIDCSHLPIRTFGSRHADNRVLSQLTSGEMDYLDL